MELGGPVGSRRPMKQRGRVSSSALLAIAAGEQSTRLSPPTTLSEPERALFIAIVSGCDSDHFREPDLPLLSRYCEAAVLAEQAAFELRNGAILDGRPSPWIVIQEKCVRAMVSLSMRLRLSPQSRIDSKTLGRQQPYLGQKPWERAE
jgi:phage terminase small subunit